MSADRTDPRSFLAPSAPWIAEALGQNAALPVVAHYIDGLLETGDAGDTGGTRLSPVFNPATGEQVATTQLADEGTVARAVAAAKAAWPAWADTAPLKRARVLFRF